MERYILDLKDMMIVDNNKNKWFCLVDTKRPDLFEGEMNEFLYCANVGYNYLCKQLKDLEDELKEAGYSKKLIEEIKHLSNANGIKQYIENLELEKAIGMERVIEGDD